MEIWTSGDHGKLQTVTKVRDCWMYSLLSAFRTGMDLLMQSWAQETLVLSICEHSLK